MASFVRISDYSNNTCIINLDLIAYIEKEDRGSADYRIGLTADRYVPVSRATAEWICNIIGLSLL